MVSKAIINLSGRDILITKGEKLVIFNLNKKEKTSIEIPAVLSFDEKGTIVEGETKVKLYIKRNFLGKKVESVKRKNRTRTFRTRGSRPHLTTVQVETIEKGEATNGN